MFDDQARIDEVVIPHDPGRKISIPDIQALDNCIELKQVVLFDFLDIVELPFRDNLQFFLDNELRVPIHYDAYKWPREPGEDPPLEESYTYRDLKINVGLTASEFDQENPEIFQK